ncbi:hypothetical protein [Actibacterium sp. D379-3]
MEEVVMIFCACPVAALPRFRDLFAMSSPDAQNLCHVSNLGPSASMAGKYLFKGNRQKFAQIRAMWRIFRVILPRCNTGSAKLQFGTIVSGHSAASPENLAKPTSKRANVRKY